MACSKIRRDFLTEEIRIVLVGKTGVGKSETGNTIIGYEKFESAPSTKSLTQNCEHVGVERFGKYLQVVDVPGFQDNMISKEENQKKIAECTTLLCPGITAILFTVRIGRYTDEDVQTVRHFMETFGPDSKDFVIVVFTGADDLTKRYDLETYIQQSLVSLKSFLREINNRYVSLNNRGSSEEKENSVKMLLEKIEQLQRENGRRCYTSQMMDDAELRMKEIDTKKLKDVEERNRERDKRIAAEAIAEYKAKLDLERIEKEELDARVADHTTAIEEDIHVRNQSEARKETREGASLAVRALSSASDKAVAGAGIGALIGLALGPLGSAVGALIGGTIGAVKGAVTDVFRHYKSKKRLVKMQPYISP